MLGLLIGWDGGSRAYGRIDTLFRDHLVGVVVATAVAFVAALLAGRTLHANVDLAWFLAFAVAADVLAGLAVIAGIGEIRLVDIGKVVFTETAAGTQLLAIAIGVSVGHALRSSPGAGDRAISAAR